MGVQRKGVPALPGQMVDVGGFRLHAEVCGQGTPAVVFEPALGGFSMQYFRMQERVSAFTRAVTYDRAGQGWSEASPNPRTPDVLCAELKTLLEKLDVRPPYILVGHSFGGLLSRIYAGRHPEEVAGVVLIDAVHEKEYDLFPDLDAFIRRSAAGVRVMKFAARVGLGKALTKLSLGPNARAFSAQDLETFCAVASQPKHHETMLAEFSQHRHYFGAQSEVPGTLGEIPLAVITAGESTGGQGKIAGVSADEVNAHHQRLQQELVKLSTRGEQMVIPGATHFTIFTQAESIAVVVETIQGMVEQARGSGDYR